MLWVEKKYITSFAGNWLQIRISQIFDEWFRMSLILNILSGLAHSQIRYAYQQSKKLQKNNKEDKIEIINSSSAFEKHKYIQYNAECGILSS